LFLNALIIVNLTDIIVKHSQLPISTKSKWCIHFYVSKWI